MEERMGSTQDKAVSVSSGTTSNRIMQDIKDTHTSTIIPVWVSAAHDPEHEVLVYALLNTQSDTMFIFKETAEAVNANSEPVQLKLSTMASRHTRVFCQKLIDLQVKQYPYRQHTHKNLSKQLEIIFLRQTLQRHGLTLNTFQMKLLLCKAVMLACLLVITVLRLLFQEKCCQKRTSTLCDKKESMVSDNSLMITMKCQYLSSKKDPTCPTTSLVLSIVLKGSLYYKDNTTFMNKMIASGDTEKSQSKTYAKA